ncbi:helix-hairpin-helix domain-containing protein [Promicromonospora panici]|uniref:helix-hairpin-helix domain-containing protein n=1 Tax=Promicromonospora panici TaxID=2219658 RepID=UPI0013ED45D7|nr:helix-hairpin-helix domain-containing protein [Promicromonospora panici]
MQPETARERPADPWPFSPVHGAGDQAQVDDARDDADELVARLRARRSTSGVAAAYAAAHGHPTDPRAEQGTHRWALTGTTAVVAVVAVLLLGLGVAAFSLGAGDGAEPLTSVAAGEESSGESASPFAESAPGSTPPGAGPAPSTSAHGGLLVHVVGAVSEPGLVTVPDGARVADALQAAGGATRKADLTALNLARSVVDGEQLYVPEPGETVPGAGAPADGGQIAPGGTPEAGGAVDINTADAVALEALPGVGPSIAQAIVEWREANGPFASVDELEDVPGIGPATLDEIRESARVGP